MPYVSTDLVKSKRVELKKRFPKFKFSVTTVHNCKIAVKILSSPLDVKFTQSWRDGVESVNHFYINEHYADQPELCKVLNEIKNIINAENTGGYEDGDYGWIPDYYIDIQIGSYEKPYVKS